MTSSTDEFRTREREKYRRTNDERESAPDTEYSKALEAARRQARQDPLQG